MHWRTVPSTNHALLHHSPAFKQRNCTFWSTSSVCHPWFALILYPSRATAVLGPWYTGSACLLANAHSLSFKRRCCAWSTVSACHLTHDRSLALKRCSCTWSGACAGCAICMHRAFASSGTASASLDVAICSSITRWSHLQLCSSPCAGVLQHRSLQYTYSHSAHGKKWDRCN